MYTISSILSPTVFFQLLISAVDSAIYLVAIDANNLFNMSTVISFYGLVCIFVPALFYCYLTEIVTSKLFSIGDIFYESAWHQLAVKQQKLVILPIRRSQQRFRLRGLGIIDCSLWVFASVSVALFVFSYFYFN